MQRQRRGVVGRTAGTPESVASSTRSRVVGGREEGAREAGDPFSGAATAGPGPGSGSPAQTYGVGVLRQSMRVKRPRWLNEGEKAAVESQKLHAARSALLGIRRKLQAFVDSRYPNLRRLLTQCGGREEISLEDWVRAVKENHFPISEEEARLIFAGIDVDGSGGLSYGELLRCFQPASLASIPRAGETGERIVEDLEGFTIFTREQQENIDRLGVFTPRGTFAGREKDPHVEAIRRANKIRVSDKDVPFPVDAEGRVDLGDPSEDGAPRYDPELHREPSSAEEETELVKRMISNRLRHRGADFYREFAAFDVDDRGFVPESVFVSILQSHFDLKLSRRELRIVLDAVTTASGAVHSLDFDRWLSKQKPDEPTAAVLERSKRKSLDALARRSQNAPDIARRAQLLKRRVLLGSAALDLTDEQVLETLLRAEHQKDRGDADSAHHHPHDASDDASDDGTDRDSRSNDFEAVSKDPELDRPAEQAPERAPESLLHPLLAHTLGGRGSTMRLQQDVVAGTVDRDTLADPPLTLRRAAPSSARFQPNLPGLRPRGRDDVHVRSMERLAVREEAKRTSLFTSTSHHHSHTASVLRPARSSLVDTAPMARLPLHASGYTPAEDIIQDAKDLRSVVPPIPKARIRASASRDLLRMEATSSSTSHLPSASSAAGDTFFRKSAAPPGAWEQAIAADSDPLVARRLRQGAGLHTTLGATAAARFATEATLARGRAGVQSLERIKRVYELERDLEEVRAEARIASKARQQLRYAFAAEPSLALPLPK